MSTREAASSGGEGGSRPGSIPRAHPAVRDCLERVRHRWQVLRLVEGTGRVLGALGVAIVVLFAADNVFHLSPALRGTLLGIALLLVLAEGLRSLILRPLHVLGDEECALLVERGEKGMENRLINSITFRRHAHTGIQATVVDTVEEEAAARLSGLSWRSILDVRASLRWVARGALAGLIVMGYAGFLPDLFRNAAERFAHPLSDVPPLTRTKLTVTPGDAELLAGSGLIVRAETQGVLPERAWLRSSRGDATLMTFNGRSFEHRIDGIVAEFTYRVEAGDARTREFRVRVLRPPEVKSLDITVNGPPYAALPPRVEQGSTGNLDVIEGSTVLLEVEANLPLRGARIVVLGGSELELAKVSAERFRGSLDVASDLEYQILLTGTEGSTSPEKAVRRRIRAIPDQPPECEVVEPGRDIDISPTAGGGLAVTVRARDDVGLASASLLAAQDADATGTGSVQEPAEWMVIATWDRIRSEREANLTAGIDPWAMAASSAPAAVGPEEAKPGPRGPPSALLYRAVAVDLKGQRTASATFRIRVLDRDAAVARAAAALDQLRSGLAEVLLRERALESGTAAALSGEPGAAATPSASRDPAVMAREQGDVRSLLLVVLSRSGQESIGLVDPRGTRDIDRELRAVASSLMPDVALRLLAAAAASAEGPRRGALELALAGERRIIEILTRAVGDLAALAARVRTGESHGERDPTKAAALRGTGDKLRNLLEKLDDFGREQREAIARTQELAGKVPEDFTGEESRSLEDLVALEEKWGRLLEDAANDLSKVAPQDMSVGSLAEEVVELVEEIDLARDYLKGKNIELAVPVEQSGVALSESLETNIERWLMRDRDRLKWVMEEPTQEFDVPLADLPSELEDIVGELIDQEELMGPETEDVTSSWLDSMDDGIGWDAMDGPISNMSAKGVTGNLQPNDMEIGGRSGEGRSGRSQGQFVEETASGKGGRQTPTRSTPDPFESGEVKDTGKDPTGGATGGGKLAGAGAQGLRGPPSPEVDRKMGALAKAQMEIRQGAEKLDLALRRRRIYPQNLERALELMRSMEDVLAARRPFRYEALRQEIVSELRGLDRTLAEKARLDVERLAAPGPALELERQDAAGEQAPAEYRDLLRDYYRSLGQGSAPPHREASREGGR